MAALARAAGSQATPRPLSAMVFNSTALCALNTTEMRAAALLRVGPSRDCRWLCMMRPAPEASL